MNSVPRSRPGGSPRGTTLLETLMVLLILGLLAGVSIPLMGLTAPQRESRQFARNLLTAHRAARFQAISLHRSIQVRYDLDRHRTEFWLCRELDSTGTCRPDAWERSRRIDSLESPAGTVNLYSVGDQADGVACMVYKPDGQILRPRDRAGAVANECPGGNDPNPGLHIALQPGADPEQPCQWVTLFHPAPGTGIPVLISYGAYPSTTGPFREYSLGESPSCEPS